METSITSPEKPGDSWRVETGVILATFKECKDAAQHIGIYQRHNERLYQENKDLRKKLGEVNTLLKKHGI